MLHKALQVDNKQLILVEKISLRSEGLGFAEGHLGGGCLWRQGFTHLGSWPYKLNFPCEHFSTECPFNKKKKILIASLADIAQRRIPR